MTFTLPELAEGSKLYIFSEQCNGDYKTDYASNLVELAIPAEDGQGSADGREVELRNNGTHIQWRYAGEDDSAWCDLVALDAITGGSGADGADGADGREVELKNDGTSILWRYVGEGDDAWRPLVALEDITGADGKQVELRVEGSYIQWRYAGGEWQNLIALSALQGIKGDKGDKGDPGDTPFIGENGNWWIGDTDTGIPATGNKGEDGLTPFIGTNGNWWIGSTDIGIRAAGQNGKDGVDGKDGQDGIGIANLVINKNGELVVTLTDGTVKNLGKVTGSDGVGIAKMEINSKGELLITLTNGTQLNAGALPVAAESSQTLVYVSLGTAGVSFAGMLGILLFLLKKKKPDG